MHPHLKNHPFFSTLLEKAPTRDPVLRSLALPTVRAAGELQRGNAARVLELLEPGRVYELEGATGMSAIYYRGLAYLALKKAPEAAREFQRILDHPGVAPLHPTAALAHLGLARAAALAGDSATARRHYQDFFALWKDADPDVPILQQARAEYARLP